MNYLPALLGKKGRFGTIWFAAHHPKKLNRYEVISIDLEDKCHEIEKFVLNGRSNTPRFSLFISSHLMFGLVVLLNKKISILHDELLKLQVEVNRPYYVSVVEAMNVVSGAAQVSTIKTPKRGGGGVRIRGKKTVMVVPVVDVVVTLKENLPDYIDKDMTLDSILAGVTSTPLRHRQAITMEDTFDLYDRSMLIAVEPTSIADFSADLFGAMPGAAIDKTMLFEPVTAQRKPRPEEEERQRLRSDERQGREVSELGTILEEGRAADATTAVPGVAGLAIPELYQETTNLFPTAHFDETLVAVAPETAVPHPQPQVAETTVAAPQPEDGGIVVRPRRIITSRRRRGPIIDESTRISLAEMNAQVAGEWEADWPEAKRKLRLTELTEHTHIDLMKQPLNSRMRQLPRRLQTAFDMRVSVAAQLRQQLGSLRPLAQPDDRFYYLTRGRGVQMLGEDSTAVESAAVIGVEIESAGISAERPEVEYRREAEIERRVDGTRGRQSTLGHVSKERESILGQDRFKELPKRLEYDESSLMTMQQIEAPPAFGYENISAGEISIGDTTTIAQQAPQIESNSMQKRILEFVEDKRALRETAILQDFIQEKPDYAERKTKKKFASRAFFNTLVLLGRQQISAKQTEFYGPIELS